MPTTYTFRTRVLSSNPYNSSYDNYNSSDSGDDNSSNYLILIFLLIVLILVAVFVGGIYKTTFETFEDGTPKPTSTPGPAKNYTLYYFKMEKCGWCVKFSNGAWKDLKEKVSSNKSKFPFVLEEVDINERTDLAQKYKVSSTPTLIFVDNNDSSKYTIFEGNRNNIDEIATFANKL